MDKAAHVVPDNGGDRHGIHIRAVNLNVLRCQIPDLAQVQTENARADNGLVGLEAQVGNAVSLTVKSARKHGRKGLCVFHIADGRPRGIFQIQIFRQNDILTCITAGAAIVDAFCKSEHLVSGRDLPGIFFRSAAAGENASLGQGRGAQAKNQAECQNQRKCFLHRFLSL